MVYHVLYTQVALAALGTALGVEQVAVVAVRAQVLLHVEFPYSEYSVLYHGVLEHEHLAQVEHSHVVVMLYDGVDVSARRQLHQTVFYHRGVSRQQVAADVREQLVGGFRPFDAPS